VELGSETRALVTGAGKGIGRALAEALVARGVRVGLVARSADQLAALAAELGEGASAHPADVADRDAITAAVSGFVADAGGLDLLVANAGIARYAPFSEQDPADADAMVQTNVLGTINTVRAGLDPMLDRGRGHVVVVSSAAALRALPWGAIYGATKAANKGFAEALRHELSGTGVSVTTVFPGEVSTEIHAEAERLPDWRKSGEEIPAADVAEATLTAVESDRREVHIPRQVRLLGLNDLAPGVVDRLLAAVRGGAAAPRR
jgi:NADP-dependent 3-hydroxy acid dehydrogenase YdfG